MSKENIFEEILKEIYLEKEKLRNKFLRKVFFALNLLAERYSFKEAYIFGSVTKKGKFSNNSDIDIGIVNLKDEYYFKVKADLFNILEKEIDLIDIPTHRLSKWIVKKGIKWKKK